MPEDYVRWSSLFCKGGLIAVVTLLCLWGSAGHVHRSARVLGVALAICLLAVVSARLPRFKISNEDYLLSFYSMMSTFVEDANDSHLRHVNLPVILGAAGVALVLAVARRDQMRAATVVTVLVLAALPGYVFYRLCTPNLLLPVVLPNPNGYDDFLAAGKMIRQLAGDRRFHLDRRCCWTHGR